VLRAISAAITATLFAVALPFAQSRPASTLDPSVIARVNQIYPGFTEVLEVCEPISLERLSRVLSEHAGRDSLAVLLAVFESCPTWSASDWSGNRSLSRMGAVVRAVGELPLEPAARMLRTGTLDQRAFAAALFGGFSNLVPAGDRGALEQAFIAALSDPDMHIRELIVGRLRLLGPGPAGQAAIDRAVADPNATRTFRWQATQTDRGADLVRPDRLAQLPLDELLKLAEVADVDQRAAVANHLEQLLSRTKLSEPDRARVMAVMSGRLRDPSVNARAAALSVLSRLGEPAAVRPVIESLNDQNVPEYYLRGAIGALGAFGSRDALPVLEKLTHRSQPQHIREDAARVYIAIAKPADAAGEVRRLLWESPDTALEKDVLARGKAALPRVWNALANGSASERRIAAALLGWFPDVRSIRPILDALARSPGAVTRDQLLFDLNMILLADGPPASLGQRNALAAAHLRWLYSAVAAGNTEPSTREAVLGQKSWAVFPDTVAAPWSIQLAARTAAIPATMPGSSAQIATDVSASATATESAQAFLDVVGKGGAGIAFHAITVVGDVARVGATLHLRLARGGFVNPTWIGLYRRDGDSWTPLQVPASHGSHPSLYGTPAGPNILPTINRNYGAVEPLKILRLDMTMERVRVDLRASQLLQNENLLPGSSHAIDRSYVPLLEKYKRSDAPSVRYTAELESTKLTGQVNVQLWIDTLAQSGTPYQAMAQQVLADYVTKQIAAEGQTLTGAARDELLATLVNSEAVDPKLRPPQALLSHDVPLVRRSDRFAMIEVAIGVGALSGSGYTMLFERRGERWVFLCVTRGWIA